MRALIFVIASFAVALPAPAAAQNMSGTSFSAGSGWSHHNGSGGHDRRRHHHDGHDGGFVSQDGRRDRNNVNDGAFLYDYYREYQGDTAWKSDSFNDWWHDRPDRAYPAWVRNNQNCERQWWAGDTLRC